MFVGFVTNIRYGYNSQEVKKFKNPYKTRSSRLNCALRDDDAVYWVSIGHYEGLAIGN